jgi:hypothetical protein
MIADLRKKTTATTTNAAGDSLLGQRHSARLCSTPLTPGEVRTASLVLKASESGAPAN